MAKLIYYLFYFYRPNITVISGYDLIRILKTQSQNSSAKIALCVDELFQNHIESITQQNLGWYQLENTVMYTAHDVFAFHGQSIYLKMMTKLIDRMISAGIMNYLIENHYTKKSKFGQFNIAPKTLNLTDFQVCFNIWMGCCALSILVFIIEQLSRLKKTSIARVHPGDPNYTSFDDNFEAEPHES
jgi:hypothetical protein